MRGDVGLRRQLHGKRVLVSCVDSLRIGLQHRHDPIHAVEHLSQSIDGTALRQCTSELDFHRVELRRLKHHRPAAAKRRLDGFDARTDALDFLVKVRQIAHGLLDVLRVARKGRKLQKPFDGLVVADV